MLLSRRSATCWKLGLTLRAFALRSASQYVSSESTHEHTSTTH